VLQVVYDFLRCAMGITEEKLKVKAHANSRQAKWLVIVVCFILQVWNGIKEILVGKIKR